MNARTQRQQPSIGCYNSMSNKVLRMTPVHPILSRYLICFLFYQSVQLCRKDKRVPLKLVASYTLGMDRPKKKRIPCTNFFFFFSFVCNFISKLSTVFFYHFWIYCTILVVVTSLDKCCIGWRERCWEHMKKRVTKLLG